MQQPLCVHLLPSLIEPDALVGGTAVIIDILRASSTMMTALRNGAAKVVPCGTPDEAFQIRQSSEPGTVLLGGERGGVRIEGFDLGNSPAEYGSSVVSGRTVAFTTTNGTRALLKASAAAEILIGSFLNRQALAERLHKEARPTHLICAGTDGAITAEDVLFAGAIVDLLQRSATNGNSSVSWILNDSANIAVAFWRHSVIEALAGSGSAELAAGIVKVLNETRGGLNLRGLGYDSDIALCSQVDVMTLIPRYVREQHCLV